MTTQHTDPIPLNALEIKPVAEHIDDDTASTRKHVEDPLQLKSDQDDLGAWKTLWRFRKAVFICTLMCIAAAADGYQVNLNGSIIANLGFTRKIGFPNAQGKYALNANYTSLWGAVQSLGQLLAMIFINPISDRVGRKYTLYSLWVVLCASLLLETFVRDWKDWTGAKFLAGFGVGAVQSTLPVYITEWAPVNIRGAMLIAYGLWNNLGNFLAPVVLLASERKDPYDYKTPILTQWVFLGLMAPIFLYLPETPWYYATKGLHDAGLKTLRRVNGKVTGYNVEAEYAVIVNTIEEERRMKSDMGEEITGFRQVAKSYVACFKGVNRKRTFAAAIPASCQQLNGLALLNIYGALFFRQAGYNDAFAVKAILTAMKIVGVVCIIFISDKFGRRRPFLISAWNCNIMLIIIGALGMNIDKSDAIKQAIIAASCLWAVTNSILGTTGWVMCGEVGSQKLRARTSGLGAGIAVLFGLTFNTAVPAMLDINGANMSFKACWVFVALGGIANIIGVFIGAETARRSPAEIDEMYENGVPAWRMRKYVTEVQKRHEERRQGRAATELTA